MPGGEEGPGDTVPHKIEPSWSLQSSRFMPLNPNSPWFIPFL